MCSWYFVQSFFMQKPQRGMCWLFDYFSKLVQNFLCWFFQKQAWKYHLTQGNLSKPTLLNEKQSNLKNKMYGNISFYSQYFSPGAGSNVHKTYFYFLKLTKKGFYFTFLDPESSIWNKNIYRQHIPGVFLG